MDFLGQHIFNNIHKMNRLGLIAVERMDDALDDFLFTADVVYGYVEIVF